MGDYMKRVWPTKLMMQQMGDLQDAYALNEAPRDQIAACALQKMRAWADADAMLSGLDDNDPMGHRQATLIILWQLYGMTNVYALVAPEAVGAGEDKAAILRWFGRLSDVIAAEFTPPAQPREKRWQWLDATTNQSDWASLVVGNVGVLTQDRRRFKFAMGELSRVLRNVAPDGSLPVEIRRGGKGVQYQSMAMTAVAGLVALADANKVALSPSEEAQLERCARFTIERTFDPAPLEAATGVKQEIKMEWLGWVDMALPHLRRTNAALAASMNQQVVAFRPMKDRFLGGTISYLFEPGMEPKGGRP